MKTQLYKASERGRADYGWLKANYSFSFANYYNPSAINFGALRVLNDDIIAGGMGFGTHPHNNMEIISIPLKGALKHRDSMSEKWIPLHTGEVQVMSAGTGIQHSEMNNSTNEEVNLFQIWIIPNKQEVEPKYSQKTFDMAERKNKLQVLVSSIDDEHKESLKIHQHAQISRLDLDKNNDFVYNLKSAENGVFIMIIEGEVLIERELLKNRDAIGIEQTKNINLKSANNSEILFVEVPMKF
jgi:redox-sensitive bicupin YhaK (pirin superfamily)